MSGENSTWLPSVRPTIETPDTQRRRRDTEFLQATNLTSPLSFEGQFQNGSVETRQAQKRLRLRRAEDLGQLVTHGFNDFAHGDLVSDHRRYASESNLFWSMSAWREDDAQGKEAVDDLGSSTNRAMLDRGVDRERPSSGIDSTRLFDPVLVLVSE